MGSTRGIFDGGWMCTQCWMPNSATAARCYRCKASDPDLQPQVGILFGQSTSPGRSTAVAAPAAPPELPAVVAVMVVIVGISVWINAILTLLAGILMVPITLLTALAADSEQGVVAMLILAAVTAVVLIWGWAQLTVARAVMARKRWAWGVVLGLSVLGVLIAIAALVALGERAEAAGPLRFVNIAIYGFGAVTMLLAILISAMPKRRRVPKTSRQPVGDWSG